MPLASVLQSHQGKALRWHSGFVQGAPTIQVHSAFKVAQTKMSTDIAEWQSVSYRSSGALAENAQVHTCTEHCSSVCCCCSLSLQNKGTERCTGVTAKSGLSLPVVLTWMDCALGKDWAAAHDSAARTPTMVLVEEAKNLIPAEVYRYTCSTSEVVSRTSGCPDHTKGDDAPLRARQHKNGS